MTHFGTIFLISSQLKAAFCLSEIWEIKLLLNEELWDERLLKEIEVGNVMKRIS